MADYYESILLRASIWTFVSLYMIYLSTTPGKRLCHSRWNLSTNHSDIFDSTSNYFTDSARISIEIWFDVALKGERLESSSSEL